MDNYKLEKMLRAVQKPGRYIGGEVGSASKNGEGLLKFAMCFPDTYEVGMSHLGMKILYDVMNSREDVFCERVFAPWFDMAEQLKQNDMKLFSLETKRPLDEFDVIGITLQYEMSFTNIPFVLELGNVPAWSRDRGEDAPFVVAGGPCACNSEPVADFFDIITPGDGEESINTLCDLLIDAKKRGLSRKQTLTEAAKLENFYVPSLYEATYDENGRMLSYKKLFDGAADRVKKSLITDLSSAQYPTKTPVPIIQAIHDRASVEVLRGCIRGCRFCQAGFIYRPFRYRDSEVLDRQARELCANTGYDELSLLSLSTRDHPQLQTLLDSLLKWTPEAKVNLSLPSLRVDSISEATIEKVSSVRKSGLTFAPEAGTQRMRDVINKNITEEEILRGCKAAFESGYIAVKLYFMLGLPFETDEDIAGIAELAQRVVDLYYSLPTKPKGKSVSVSVSCSCFVPKPFTPFERCAANTLDELYRKQALLRSSIRSKKISLSMHDPKTTVIEAALAKGDRRLSGVIYSVYKSGGIFDSWDEGFSFDRWAKAFEDNGLDIGFYANRELLENEYMPWYIMDYGIDKRFLESEYKKASLAATTPDCLTKCSGCGMAAMCGGKCVANR